MRDKGTQKNLTDLSLGEEDLSEDKYPSENQQIQKGWAPAQRFGSIEKRIGEVFAYHRRDEKSDHRINVDTVKILYFEKDRKCSLHFHKVKDEFFVCAYGQFLIEIIENGKKFEKNLTVGNRLFIPNCTPHRITGVEDVNILIEVSTEDKPEDSYRIEKGD